MPQSTRRTQHGLRGAAYDDNRPTGRTGAVRPPSSRGCRIATNLAALRLARRIAIGRAQRLHRRDELLVWVALPFWYLLVPAMVVHGVTIVTLFAPMHECIHRTAFASRTANLIVGWIAGVLSFYNSTYYRHYHSWHHRYTQDPARDPELMVPNARNRIEYLIEISAVMFWVRRAIDYPALALGRTGQPPFVPGQARKPIVLSM